MTATGIFKMFGRSPIRPLQEHMGKVHECASTLRDFFAAVLLKDWKKAEQKQSVVVQLEHDADKIKKDIRTHLPKGLFLPFPRSDLLEILTMQDKIADKVKDIAGVVLGRHMNIPEAIAASYDDLLNRTIESVAQAQKATNELDELLETGFRGNEVHVLSKMIAALRETEHATDELQIIVRRQLFAIEAQLSPVDVIFLYKIINWTGEIADHAEQVGNRLELLLAK